MKVFLFAIDRKKDIAVLACNVPSARKKLRKKYATQELFYWGKFKIFNYKRPVKT